MVCIGLRARAERSASASGWWVVAEGFCEQRLTPVSMAHASHAGLVEDGALPLGKMTHREACFLSLGSGR